MAILEAPFKVKLPPPATAPSTSPPLNSNAPFVKTLNPLASLKGLNEVELLHVVILTVDSVKQKSSNLITDDPAFL